jgi:hypothetical protein
MKAAPLVPTNGGIPLMFIRKATLPAPAAVLRTVIVLFAAFHSALPPVTFDIVTVALEGQGKRVSIIPAPSFATRTCVNANTKSVFAGAFAPIIVFRANIVTLPNKGCGEVYVLRNVLSASAGCPDDQPIVDHATEVFVLTLCCTVIVPAASTATEYSI